MLKIIYIIYNVVSDPQHKVNKYIYKISNVINDFEFINARMINY